MNRMATNAAASRVSRLELTHGAVAQIDEQRGTLLCVERGRVWISQYGLADDFCLEAGQSYRLGSDGLSVATTLGRDTAAVVTLDRSETAVSRSAWRCWFRRFAAAARTSPATSTRTA